MQRVISLYIEPSSSPRDGEAPHWCRQGFLSLNQLQWHLRHQIKLSVCCTGAVCVMLSVLCLEEQSSVSQIAKQMRSVTGSRLFARWLNIWTRQLPVKLRRRKAWNRAWSLVCLSSKVAPSVQSITAKGHRYQSPKQKREKKGKEDVFRQSLSNGSQPRDVHVLALDEIEDSVLHPCEVCRLQKIEAAGNGTVPAAAESRWQPHDHERSKPNQRDVATGFAFWRGGIGFVLLCLSPDVATCSCLNGKSSTCKSMTVPQHLPSIDKSRRFAYENEMCVDII